MVWRRLTYVDGLLENLAELTSEVDGKDHCPKEPALELLRKLTQQDFGYDLNAWIEWLKSVPEDDVSFSWIAKDLDLQKSFFNRVAKNRKEKGLPS